MAVQILHGKGKSLGDGVAQCNRECIAIELWAVPTECARCTVCLSGHVREPCKNGRISPRTSVRWAVRDVRHSTLTVSRIWIELSFIGRLSSSGQSTPRHAALVSECEMTVVTPATGVLLPHGSMSLVTSVVSHGRGPTTILSPLCCELLVVSS